jgi:stage II sporulation protein D
MSFFGLFASVCAKELEIDIGLIDSSTRNYFRANKDYKVYTLAKNARIDNTLMLKKAKAFTLIRYATATNEKLVIASEPDLASSSKNLLLSCSDKEIESDCIWTVMKSKTDKNPRRYRGAILIKVNDGNFTVINRVKLEDYLKGVVASEMPSSWHPEALKAQSVAARTYTISKLNRRRNLGYDLKPTVEDQVYLGVGNEKSSTNQAIKATEGLIMVDPQDKPVEAYFYSQAGFSTASAHDVWGLEHQVYLRPQIMIDNNKFWQKNFTASSLSTKLADLKLGQIKAVTILNSTPEGRVKDILISNGTKDVKLTGEELRHKLGLRSTFFDTRIYNKKSNPAQNLQMQGLRSDEKLSLLSVNDTSRSKRNAAVGDFEIGFIGKGFGHGIGMSQYGAKKLAEQGKKFKEIMNFYYPGTKLIKI